MNKLAVLTIGAFALACGSATAADLPVKAASPVQMVVPSGWSGFYLGAHGGYGWKSNDFAEVISVDPLLTISGIDSDGWVFGGHFGYNWQYGVWVVGLELDMSATGIKGDSSTVVRNLGGGFTLSDTLSDDVQYLGTARARVGYTPFYDWLFYATGGLAWERVDRISTQVLSIPGLTQTVVSRDPRDHFGWVIGAGVEVKLFGSNWIGRLEYLHYDFGSVESTTSVTTTTAGQSFADNEGRQTIDVVRAGLSYKF